MVAVASQRNEEEVVATQASLEQALIAPIHTSALPWFSCHADNRSRPDIPILIILHRQWRWYTTSVPYDARRGESDSAEAKISLPKPAATAQLSNYGSVHSQLR
mmetsp:Transcript_42683/g.76807  ORF Transcript_42683/g.76807 Transcript_42683/m.76807 type:complete len:104 (-) Transcript_42683:366-677(-)